MQILLYVLKCFLGSKLAVLFSWMLMLSQHYTKEGLLQRMTASSSLGFRLVYKLNFTCITWQSWHVQVLLNIAIISDNRLILFHLWRVMLLRKYWCLSEALKFYWNELIFPAWIYKREQLIWVGVPRCVCVYGAGWLWTWMSLFSVSFVC